MSGFIMPGNNTLTLCPAALCLIVQAHLRDAGYGDTKNLRVTAVKLAEGSFAFSVTTDAQEARDAAAA